MADDIFGDGSDGDLVLDPGQLTRDATYKTMTGEDLVRVFGGIQPEQIDDDLLAELIAGGLPADPEEAAHLVYLMATEIVHRRRLAKGENYKQKQIKRCRQAIEKLVATLDREETT